VSALRQAGGEDIEGRSSHVKAGNDKNRKIASSVPLSYAENIFGFALIRDENVRWWLGPLVRVGIYSGETDTFNTGGGTQQIDFDYAEIGFGAVTGVNFNIKDRLILAPSIGFRHCVFAGTGEINEYSGGVHYYWEEDITGEVTSVFANFAVLF
jgi:hypothetical protein